MVNPKLGLNGHLVSATDRLGNASEFLYVYFPNTDYISETEPLPKSLSLLLTQSGSGIDDESPAEPITSLDDLFMHQRLEKRLCI